MSEEEKEAEKEYERNRYRNITEDKKNKLKEFKKSVKQQKNKILVFLYNVKMSEKILKYGDDEVNKKEFPASKQPNTLNLLDIDKIVISDKFKHSGKGSIYTIGYKDDDIIRPLCIVLLQMIGYIKYSDNSGKNMSLKIEDDSVLVKYNDIWNKI